MEHKLSIQHCKNLGILKTGDKRGVLKLLACTVNKISTDVWALLIH